MTTLDARFAVSELEAFAAAAGVRLELDDPPTRRCPNLDLASSGLLSLTGFPEAPVLLDAPLVGRVAGLCDAIARLTGRLGEPVTVDPGRVLVERAAERGFARAGQTSANGTCRLIRCADGWLACNLARPDDGQLVAVALGRPEHADPWGALAEAGSSSSACVVAERLQLLGVAAAVLGETGGGDPVRLVRLGERAERPDLRRRLVADFSAMWAGPLCARIFGRAGADVVQVEDPARPDGARVGDPAMHGRLHEGHGLLSASFASAAGREEIRRLVERADIVIEASRPRALGALGLSPEAFLAARAGRTWVSITGHGRSGVGSHRVAFGDDAAVAGGLVAWSEGRPVFCGDAIADPLTGLTAAFGALVSIADGGGLLVDAPMSAAAAFAGRGPRCPGAHGVHRGDDGRWVATHDELWAPVLTPAEALAAGG